MCPDHKESRFQVANRNCTRCGENPPSRHAELDAVLDALDDAALLARLQEYRPVGRQGYPIKALWRAYVASFILNLPHTNALIRRLTDDLDFRALCGFRSLPHRTTFNRFIQRLSDHPDLVEAVFAKLTDQLKAILPDLGEQVAVDSTTVRSHCNPNRKRISDPEASWTAKNKAGAKESGKEWNFGYKVHMVADTNYGVPLGHIVTTAKRGDTTELPTVIAYAEALYPWFRPSVVVADRGYDSMANHKHLISKDIAPVIHIRSNAHRGLKTDIHTWEGVPTCIGKVPMKYVSTDPVKGRLYRCAGCPLSGTMRSGSYFTCDDEVWQDPNENIRLFGVIRRDGPEWKALYAKRQAIERVFKSMKESLRLERHCVRGLKQIRLHAAMSALAYQTKVLLSVRSGESRWMRWMVPRVA